MNPKTNSPAPKVGSSALVRRFRYLPLGTRFRYVKGGSVWVILERHGCGLIAKWEGIDGPVSGQSICSLKDTEEECETAEVEVVDSANDKDVPTEGGENKP